MLTSSSNNPWIEPRFGDRRVGGELREHEGAGERLLGVGVTAHRAASGLGGLDPLVELADPSAHHRRGTRHPVHEGVDLVGVVAAIALVELDLLEKW